MESIHDAHSVEELAVRVSDGLRPLLDADVGSFNWYDQRRGALDYRVSPAACDRPGARAIYQRFARQNPVAAHFVATGDPRSRRLSDFAGLRAFERLALYQEFYRPADIRFHLVAGVGAAAASLVVAAFRRRRDFGEPERRLLDAVEPHITRAHQRAQRWEQLERAAALPHAALALLGLGVARLDPEGGVLEPTLRAEELLARYLGTAGQRAPRLRAWLASAASGEAPAPLVVVQGDRQLVARVAPAGPVRALVLAERWATMPAPLLERLGLSRREAQVLARVAEGESDAAVAARLCISFRTVKKHLEHVFRKLHAQSRAEAVARAQRACRDGLLGLPVG